MYLPESKEKKNVSCSSCRIRGQRSKLSYRHSALGEIKVKLLLGRKVMTNLDSILKSRDITLPTKSI